MGHPKSNIRSDCKDRYYNFALREARINAGYTAAELANKVRLSTMSIYAFERLRAYPEDYTAQKIAGVLGADIGRIFPQNFKVIVSELRKERNKESKHYKEIPYGASTKLEDELEPVPSRAPGMINSLILKERLERNLGALGFREREIIKLRYGLDNNNPYSYTLEEVARIFNITRERVRQIEAKAITKLQHPIRRRKLIDFLDKSKV